MGTLSDIERDLAVAGDKVMELQDRLEAGEALDPAEYDAVLVPFNEYLTLAKQKRDRFVEFLLYLQSQEEMFATRIKLDSARKNAIVNLIGRLKGLAQFVMTNSGSVKLEGEARVMTLANNSQFTLTIHAESKLPEKCFKTVRVVDNEAVRACIREGEITADVAELTRGQHLRIR